MILIILLLINTDRGEVPKGSAEIFFRKVKFWKEDEEEEAPPVFVGLSVCKTIAISSLFQVLVILKGKKNLKLVQCFSRLC